MPLNEALDQIINNFEQQTRLYAEMAELAQVQLENLQVNGHPACLDEVNRILVQRKEIIDQITPINEENKNLQQAVLQELPIDAFSIKNLKGRIPEEQFARLKLSVNGVQRLLEVVDQADRASEVIMRRGVPGSSSGKAVATHKQAAQAYSQAQKQGKPQ